MQFAPFQQVRSDEMMKGKCWPKSELRTDERKKNENFIACNNNG